MKPRSAAGGRRLQLHQPLGGESQHFAHKIRIRLLLNWSAPRLSGHLAMWFEP